MSDIRPISRRTEARRPSRQGHGPSRARSRRQTPDAHGTAGPPAKPSVTDGFYCMPNAARPGDDKRAQLAATAHAGSKQLLDHRSAAATAGRATPPAASSPQRNLSYRRSAAPLPGDHCRSAPLPGDHYHVPVAGTATPPAHATQVPSRRRRRHGTPVAWLPPASATQSSSSPANRGLAAALHDDAAATPAHRPIVATAHRQPVINAAGYRGAGVLGDTQGIATAHRQPPTNTGYFGRERQSHVRKTLPKVHPQCADLTPGSAAQYTPMPAKQRSSSERRPNEGAKRKYPLKQSAGDSGRVGFPPQHHSGSSIPPSTMQDTNLYEITVCTSEVDLLEVSFCMRSARSQTPWLSVTAGNLGLVLPYNKPLNVLAPRLRYRTVPVGRCAAYQANGTVWIVYLLSHVGSSGSLAACELKGTSSSGDAVSDLGVVVRNVFGDGCWSFTADPAESEEQSEEGEVTTSDASVPDTCLHVVEPISIDPSEHRRPLSLASSSRSPYKTTLERRRSRKKLVVIGTDTHSTYSRHYPPVGMATASVGRADKAVGPDAGSNRPCPPLFPGVQEAHDVPSPHLTSPSRRTERMDITPSHENADRIFDDVTPECRNEVERSGTDAKVLDTSPPLPADQARPGLSRARSDALACPAPKAVVEAATLSSPARITTNSLSEDILGTDIPAASAAMELPASGPPAPAGTTGLLSSHAEGAPEHDGGTCGHVIMPPPPPPSLLIVTHTTQPPHADIHEPASLSNSGHLTYLSAIMAEAAAATPAYVPLQPCAETDDQVASVPCPPQPPDANVTLTPAQDKLRAMRKARVKQRTRQKAKDPAVDRLQDIAGKVVYDQWRTTSAGSPPRKLKSERERSVDDEVASLSVPPPDTVTRRMVPSARDMQRGDSHVSLPERNELHSQSLASAVRQKLAKRDRLRKQLSEDPGLYSRRSVTSRAGDEDKGTHTPKKTVPKHFEKEESKKSEKSNVHVKGGSVKRAKKRRPGRSNLRVKALIGAPGSNESSLQSSVDAEGVSGASGNGADEGVLEATAPSGASCAQTKPRSRHSHHRRSAYQARNEFRATGRDVMATVDIDDVSMNIQRDEDDEPRDIDVANDDNTGQVGSDPSSMSPPMSESNDLAGFESDDSLSVSSLSTEATFQREDSAIAGVAEQECMHQINLVKNLSSNEGYPYLIFVKTDNSPKASSGPNGMVCVVLVGEYGCSEEIYLSQSLTCSEKFCRGQVDAFHIRLHAPLGELFFIDISYLTPKFFQPRWCLQSVYVVDETDQWQFEFVPRDPIWFGWASPGIMKTLRRQKKAFMMSCQLECQNSGQVKFHLPGSKLLRENSVAAPMADTYSTPWVRALFEGADKNGDGRLNEGEIILMAKRLNMPAEAVAVFLKASKEATSDSLNLQQFSMAWKYIERWPEIDEVFCRFSSNQQYLSEEDWALFQCGQCQENEMSLTDAIDKYETYVDDRLPFGVLSQDGFRQFLISDECDVCDEPTLQRQDDMSHPLSHYYIASSHNTYLVADQVKGPSTEQGYARALRAGCRCVELDCWDVDGQPVITHGHTLTQRLDFRKALLAIRDNAFFASPYPVILSFENHCSVPVQGKIALELLDVFGDTLYLLPPDEDCEYLPSPEQLKGRILIKNKKAGDVRRNSRGHIERVDSIQPDSDMPQFAMTWHGSDRKSGSSGLAAHLATSPVVKRKMKPSSSDAGRSSPFLELRKSAENISISVDDVEVSDVFQVDDPPSKPSPPPFLSEYVYGSPTRGSDSEPGSSPEHMSRIDKVRRKSDFTRHRSTSTASTDSSRTRMRRGNATSRLSTLEENVSLSCPDDGACTSPDSRSAASLLLEDTGDVDPADGNASNPMVRHDRRPETVLGSWPLQQDFSPADTDVHVEETGNATPQHASTLPRRSGKSRKINAYRSSLVSQSSTEPILAMSAGDTGDVLLFDKLEAEINRQNYNNNRPNSPSKSVDAFQTKESRSGKVAKELSMMVNIIQPVKFTSLKSGKYWEMSSINENVLKRLLAISSTAQQLVGHTQKQIIRVYPAGRRIESSNYNPVDAWNSGAQMVALNYQTPGLAMDLNNAMFGQNGRCGMVLKPPFLRQDAGPFNCMTNSPPAFGVQAKRLTIRILSGHHLPKPNCSSTTEVISPVVCVDVWGIPLDRADFKSKQVNQNGFHAVIGDQVAFTVNNPELAFVRFSVLDCGKPDRLVGQLTLPFRSVRPGFRNVHLLSQTGHTLPGASLFVHITINSLTAKV